MMSSIVEDAPAAVAAQFASRRVYRLLSMSLGVATVLEMAAVISGMIIQVNVLTPLFTAVAVTLITAPALIALATFTWAPLHSLRWIWRVQAVAMFLVYALIPVALGGAKIPPLLGLTWIGEIEVVAGCAAILAWRIRTAIVYAVVWQTMVFGIAILWGESPFQGLAVGNTLRQLFYVAMFMCLAAALIRAGRMLDDTVDRAVRDAQASAIAERRRSTRERVEMLIHDKIIVVLLAYASGAGANRSAIAAESALAAMRADAHDGHAPTPRLPRMLAWELQALTTRLDPGIRFDFTASGDDAVPAEVGSAVAEALSEALRNSLRHAGGTRTVRRQVHASITSDRIEVLVLDDGHGFDPDETGPSRLGIRHGLIRRMRRVPGGDATVRSVIGYGTAVSLRWSRP